MVIRQLPPSSALVQSFREGEPPVWTRQDQLLAAAVDQLRILAWQNTADGRKGRRPPRPIPRPGVEPEKTTYGTDPVSIEEMADWLGWERQMTEGTTPQ